MELGTIEELQQMALPMLETNYILIRKDRPTSSKQILSPPETEVVFNLSCEPAYKYSLPGFADYGCDPTQRTSNALHDSALYLETLNKRYEISKEGGIPGKGETYRIAEVLDPFLKNSDFMARNTIPLGADHAKVQNMMLNL